MENLSKEDEVARRLRGDAVEMVEEREEEVSVTVKGRQMAEPERRSYPKRFPEGEGKLVAVYVVYFKSQSRSKLIAVPSGVYYRPESRKFISYTSLEEEGFEIGSLDQDTSPGDLERKEKDNKEISLLYHNPNPIPGGEREKTCRSGFVECDPEDLPKLLEYFLEVNSQWLFADFSLSKEPCSKTKSPINEPERP